MMTWTVDYIDLINYFLFPVPEPPKIVKEPPPDELLFQVSTQAEQDKPFIIECEAEGEPAPK